MSQHQIRQLFNLGQNENIFDDFSCYYNGLPGRMYLSQKHTCFYSTFLGRTTILKLPFEKTSKL